MSKLIPLTQCQYALVDDEDYEKLNKYKWCAHYKKSVDGYYAVRNSRRGKRPMIRMHRVIMGDIKGQMVDHINHDTLDNRKSNLRICTNSQNNMNRLPNKNASSKYKGVCWVKHAKKWRSRVKINGKNIYLGYFENEISAAKAYDKKAKELFGEFAYVNLDWSDVKI